MIHNISIDHLYIWFSFVLDYASCDCMVSRSTFKLTVENEKIFEQVYDRSDKTHSKGHQMLGEQLNLLCKNNNWKLWNI